MTRASRFGVPVLLLVAPLLFFHEVCLGGQAFLLRDLFNWFYPWRTFAAQSLARGDPPLWNPYSYTGTPFLANMQSGLLYPPNLVFWFFDFPNAMRLFVIIQFALSAVFMYLLMRALQCRTTSALTGSIAFAYGGWMLVHIEFPNKLAAASWLPLVVLGLVLWWRGRRAVGLAAGALATACCITAGYPQTTFTVFLGAGVLWAAAVGSAARRWGPAAALREAASLPSMIVLGTLVAAAQVVPFLEALGRSMRQLGGFDVLKLGLSPFHFLGLIYPHLFGLPGYSRYWGGELLQFWLGHFYVGLPTLLLAACAPAMGRLGGDPETARDAAPFTRRGTVWAFLLLLALAVAFCLGDRTPLAPFCLEWLPGFDYFKWMSTTSILAAFPLCALAAFGMEVLLEAAQRGRPLGRPLRVLLALVAVCSASLMALGLLAAIAPGAFDEVARALITPVVQSVQEALIAGHLGPVRTDAVAAGVAAALLGAAWLAVRAGRLKLAWLSVLIPLVVFLDLKLAATGINHTADPDIYREVPRKVQELLARPDPLFRVFVDQETLREDLKMYGSVTDGMFRWAANTLLFNLNLPHRLFSASDGDPMYGRRWGRYQQLLFRLDDTERRGRLLAAANIGILLRGARGRTETAEVPAYLPRVYLASGARRILQGDALDAMLEPDWDPYREVLVEGDFPGVPRDAAESRVVQRVEQVTYTNNTVTIQVEGSRDAYLVLLDAIYPGWEASVDGSPTPIFTANYLFRGIDLPAGRHAVRFRYRPASLRWGVLGSLVGMTCLGVILRRDVAALGRRAIR